MPFLDFWTTEPDPLTPMEKRVLWVVGVAIAVTRLLALSRTLWDWDECLFVLGVRHFNPALHRPHPPGFPLYIALGKLFRLFMHDDFRALQRINLIAASLLFPALFKLGRELRLTFGAAMASGLILCFMPNVFYFGGTAFSDVPALALLLAACACLLHGCRSRRSFLTGTLLLALSMAIRPQTIMIALVPGLIATAVRWRHRAADVFAALMIGVTVLVLAYGPCIVASGGWGGYQLAVSKHRRYFLQVDTYRNPARPSVAMLAGDFLVHPYKSEDVGQVLFPLACAGLAVALIRREHRFYLTVLASFLPFAVFALFMVDFNSVTRYSIAYVPMFALFGGRMIGALGELPLRPGWNRFLETSALLTLILWLGCWSIPVVGRVAGSSSPPVAAIRWIRGHLTPSRTTIYVAGAMEPYSKVFLPDYRCVDIEHDTDVPIEAGENAFLFQEGATSSPPGQNFFRKHGRLFRVARQRYFEVSVAPLSSVPHFGKGWYSAEGTSPDRWMAGRSEMALPSLDGPGQLEMEIEIPKPLVAVAPTVSLLIDGVRAGEQVVRTIPFTIRLTVPEGRTHKSLRLTIITSSVANPARLGVNDDDRDLGLMIHNLSWRPLAAIEVSRQADTTGH